MRLQNEFTVAVPLERAWETLLDIRTVAGFLPGAILEEHGEDGIYRGTMRVRVGPMSVNYQGSARLGTVDAEARTVDITVEARELKGQGTASAVVTNTLVPDGTGTRVVAVTELQVTGRQAQFGRGIMQDIAGRMLDEFARRFEAHLLEPASPGADDAAPAGQGATPSAASAAQAEPESLDLGSAIARTMVRRYAGIAAGAAAGLAVVLLARRRSG
jgi:carbon monoxide dehydrogenase subunit G